MDSSKEEQQNSVPKVIRDRVAVARVVNKTRVPELMVASNRQAMISFHLGSENENTFLEGV